MGVTSSCVEALVVIEASASEGSDSVVEKDVFRFLVSIREVSKVILTDGRVIVVRDSGLSVALRPAGGMSCRGKKTKPCSSFRGAEVQIGMDEPRSNVANSQSGAG